MTILRFAPSPSGPLHLGHAYSAFFTWAAARAQVGSVRLRIEDIDTTRCTPEFTDKIIADLRWLGLRWDGPPYIQSQHLNRYTDALNKLDDMGLLYPCFCTRKSIQREIATAGRAPHGPEGPLYPGICRNLTPYEQDSYRAQGLTPALRLHLDKALSQIAHTGTDMTWHDRKAGRQTATPQIISQYWGDVVLARKDIGASYHLCVVVDDAHQNITEVTRGEDLFTATHLHRLLQALLGLPVPLWSHHGLLRDEKGQRLAKRDRARALETLRADGYTVADIRAMTGFVDNIGH